MKKTIAKIMAAAMVLSAVPAVALPTLTAKADGVSGSEESATISTANSAISSNGTTNVKYAAGTKATQNSNGSLTVGSDTVTVVTENSNTTATAFADTVSLSLNNDGYVVVNVAQSSADDKKAIIAAVKTGDNAIELAINGTATGDVIYPGGKMNTKTNQIESDIIPGDGDLADGDVYAEIDNSSKLELDIVKGKNDDLDGNDDLRGDTLDLTTVSITGVEYDIVKVGAQALKKAHMKRVKAENVKNVGKGAFRGCKQVKKIDLQDSNKIRKINSKAFYGDKNLNTIIIDGRKLNTVGKNAFAGVKKNCTVKIRAKKSKYNSDVKMIKKNGGNSNLKFVRK